MSTTRADSERSSSPNALQIGLLLVLLGALSRISRAARAPLLDFLSSANLSFDLELSKLLWLIPLILLIAAVMSRPHFRLLRVDSPLVMLVVCFLYAGASLMWADSIRYGLAWWMRWIMPLASYLVIINYTKDWDALKAWASIFPIMAFGVLAVCLRDLTFDSSMSFGDPDYDVAGWLGPYTRWAVMSFGFCIHHSVFGEKRSNRILGFLGVIAAAGAVYITQRRAGAIACALIVIVYLIAIGYRRKRYVFTFAGFAAVAAIALIADPQYAQRLATIPFVGGAGLAAWEGTPRAIEMLAGLQVFQENWIIGVGAGNVIPRMQEIMGNVVRAVPHNLIVTMGAEFGVVGLAIYLAFIALAFRRMHRALRTNLAEGKLHRASLCAAIVATFIAIMFYAMVQPIRYYLYIYMLAALGSVAYSASGCSPRADTDPAPDAEEA